ncbi:MAG TPA: tol-pal system protein YbgF [Gammaproteobacteria bacterium]|nr:tol-pal system protein YbgF [Gammaproteobacteria bacterium]
MMRSSGIAVLAGVCVLLAGCQVRDDDPYAVRERQLEARVDRLDQVFSKNQSLQGLSQRIDDLQDQLNKIRGDVEVLEHGEDLSQKQQRDLYQDLDKRLQKLEQGLGGGSAAPAAGTAPAAADAAPPAPSAGGGPDDAAYQKSFDQLKKGRFTEAIKGFKAFVKQYPSSALAPNAEFWTGEAYYQMSDFVTALASFRKTIKDYPQSNKTGDAMLKVGYCQYELKQWKSARETLNAVVQKYPGSNAANLATQRLQRMQGEGH